MARPLRIEYEGAFYHVTKEKTRKTRGQTLTLDKMVEGIEKETKKGWSNRWQEH